MADHEGDTTDLDDGLLSEPGIFDSWGDFAAGCLLGLVLAIPFWAAIAAGAWWFTIR